MKRAQGEETAEMKACVSVGSGARGTRTCRAKREARARQAVQKSRVVETSAVEEVPENVRRMMMVTMACIEL